MYIVRTLENRIMEKLFKRRAIIVYGPRRAGKTSMIRHIVENLSEPVLWINADEPGVAQRLDKPTEQLKTYFGKAKIIVIDEAQSLPAPGLIIKRIVDYAQDYQVIATGSSSFELAGKITEPLTGRKWEFPLYPFSVAEISSHTSRYEVENQLENLLIYGTYPEVYLNRNKTEILSELTSSYLFKDVLAYQGIRKSEKIRTLTIALAMQIGREFSYRELSDICGLDPKTVEKYIDLLEKAFVVFRLPSFSKNLRNELKRKQKIYFWDMGIRNALIEDFRPMAMRTDAGYVWENFIVAERMKFIRTNALNYKLFFWRTTQQQEIDLIEIRPDKMLAVEIKFNARRKPRLSKTFAQTYPQAKFRVVNPQNFFDYLLDT